MGTIKNSADETEYLNEGKGCTIWVSVFLVLAIASAGLGVYLMW